MENNVFDSIKIGLASPEQIRNWSYGEVKTVSYTHLDVYKRQLVQWVLATTTTAPALGAISGSSSLRSDHLLSSNKRSAELQGLADFLLRFFLAEDMRAAVPGCLLYTSMGPLELGDFIGLDICLAIMDVLYKETGDRDVYKRQKRWCVWVTLPSCCPSRAPRRPTMPAVVRGTMPLS